MKSQHLRVSVNHCLMQYLLVIAAIACSTGAVAETPESDPQGVRLAKLALAALGSSSKDFTAQAHVTHWIEGKAVEGAAELYASGPRAWRVNIVTPSGDLSEAHVHGHRLFRASGDTSVREEVFPVLGAEFSPGHSLLARILDSDVRIEYLGVETFAGHDADHIRLLLGGIGADHASHNVPERLHDHYSQEDFFLDRVSHLPLGLRYNYPAEVLDTRQQAGSCQPLGTEHARTGAQPSCPRPPHRHYPVPVEVRFSDFRNMNGEEIPFVIDRYAMGRQYSHFALDTIDASRQLNQEDFRIK